MSTKHGGFTAKYYKLIIGLAGLAIVFAMLNAYQGPRLLQAAVDPHQVVGTSNSRLVFNYNQPLAAVRANQITVTPRTDYIVAVHGGSVTLRFADRLRFNTRYTVALRNIHGATGTHPTSTSYSFTTSDASLYYITPTDIGSPGEPGDRVVRSSLSGGQPQTLFTAPKIDEFAVSGNSLVVITGNADRTSKLYEYDMTTRETTELKLPGSGTAADLQASVDGYIFGYSFTSRQLGLPQSYSHVLFTFDVRSTKRARPVQGLDGKPQRIIDWRFAPDATTLLVQGANSDLLLVDTRGKHPQVPLGQLLGISNFSSTGVMLAALDKDGLVLINALTLAQSRLNVLPESGRLVYPAQALLLQNSEGYIARSQTFDTAYGRPMDRYEITQSGTAKIFYTMDAGSTVTSRFNLSPNDQYMAVEYDARAAGQAPRLRIDLVDVATGKIVRSIAGSRLSWQ